ncbi:MAG: UDP-N-acetylmuramoyl-tripeptide--D-alanyl-D-alanine ligase [Thermoanaerobaculia bacterium]
MPRLSPIEIAAMCGGELVQGGEVSFPAFVIDSREATEDSLFFAIRGERLDGHDYLPEALGTARGAVVSRVPDPLPAGKVIIRVADTTRALQDLARGVRSRFDWTLIGITGSAGKTTTKEMIATLIATERRTARSRGNFNNHIGLPLGIVNAPDDTEVYVSEMGMSAKGEIEFLATLASPDLGVYTTIKPVHLEFFGSLDGIAAAKRELLENMKQDGTIVINADDPKVMEISRGFPGRKVTYGSDAGAEYRAEEVRERGLLGTSFRLSAEGTSRTFDLPMPGRHNMENLLAAIAAARAIGIGWEGIEKGVAAVRPAAHRGIVIRWNGATLYDDTYNSNPYALGRALELLAHADCEGRRIAVVGDMLELGGDEIEFHREAGRKMPEVVDTVVAVGPRSKAMLDGAAEAGFEASVLHHFDDASAATEFLRTFITAGDLVLLKASRGIGLDKIVTTLESEV